MFTSKECVEYLPMIFLFVLISCVTNWIAYKRKFYTLPKSTETPLVTLPQVLGCFAIYFIVFLPLAHFLFQIALEFLPSWEKTSIFALTQICSTFLCFFFFGYLPVFLKKRLFTPFGKTPLYTLNPPYAKIS
ncbi:MAG: hypothetical protein V4489_08265 [Chlamydiota bacterium]